MWYWVLLPIQARGSLRARLAGQKLTHKASLKSPQFPREYLKKPTPSQLWEILVSLRLAPAILELPERPPFDLPTALPATLPPSPPIRPRFARGVTTSPALFPFLPVPLRLSFGIPTRSSKAHLRCAGLVWVFLSTHVGTVGSLERPCSPLASVQRGGL